MLPPAGQATRFRRARGAARSVLCWWPVNVLFVCSKNQWRSPTAERVFRPLAGLSVRSAGTSQSARRVVSARDLAWAEVVFVMERKHLDRLREAFRAEIRTKIVHVLEIPDDYGFMDDELVRLLEERVGEILETMRSDDGPDEPLSGH